MARIGYEHPGATIALDGAQGDFHNIYLPPKMSNQWDTTAYQTNGGRRQPTDPVLS